MEEYGCQNVICPFFRGYENTKIYCESVVEDAHKIETVHRFQNKYLKQNHAIKYCESYNYEKCAYASYLNKKI